MLRTLGHMESSEDSQPFLRDIVEKTLAMNLDADWIDAVLYVPYQSKSCFPSLRVLIMSFR